MTNMTNIENKSISMFLLFLLIIKELFALPSYGFAQMAGYQNISSVYEMAQLAALASHCTPSSVTGINRHQLRSDHAICQCLNNWPACLNRLSCQSGVMYPQLISNNSRLLHTFSTYSAVPDIQDDDISNDFGLKAGGKGFIIDLGSSSLEDGHVELAIGFAGSTVLEDWLHDFRAWLVPYPSIENILETTPSLKYQDGMSSRKDESIRRVHRGFYAMYNTFRRDLLMKLDSIISEYSQTKKWISLSLTGHSMGGALSLLLMHDLLECISRRDHCPFKHISSQNDLGQFIISGLHVYTYGQPKVGDAAFVQSLHSLVDSLTTKSQEKRLNHQQGLNIDYIRVMNSQDIVPALPPAFLGYEHFNLRQRYFAFNISEIINPPSLPERRACHKKHRDFDIVLPKFHECTVESSLVDVNGNLVDPQNPLCRYRLDMSDGSLNNGHPLYFWNFDNVKRECKLISC